MEGGQNVQEKSLISRLFTAETLIFCVGICCIVYSVANGFSVMQMFFGICIVGGSLALRLVRKKDWDAHWAEMDAVRKAHEMRMAQEREKKG